MNRREFITLLGGSLAGALALPRRARPAPPQVRPEMLRVGTASPTSRSIGFLLGFEGRMKELGYIEGTNWEFDYRDLKGDASQYGNAMQDLVRRNVDIIVAFGPEASLKAAVAATKTIPIVMVAIDYDPIALGYVSGLARPTGNVTGLFLEQIELTAKRLQLIKDALPTTGAATVFWDQLSADQWRIIDASAAKFGLQVTGIEFKDYPYDYERALAQAPPEYRRFLIATTSPFFARDRAQLAEFTLRHQIASMFVFREYVDLGGLMSYGPSREAMSRRTADYVNRIARGAKPSDLPVEAPTRFETVINLKTAKALGLEFSQAILLRADEVIE
jgi:putative ABC transport system substrate-binding protein